MKIKTLIVVDDAGKEYAFTHRSLVEDKTYDPSKDPEVQGTGLADLQAVSGSSTGTVTITNSTSTTGGTAKVGAVKAKKKKK